MLHISASITNVTLLIFKTVRKDVFAYGIITES